MSELPSDELRELFSALCDGVATSAQMERLDELLRSDAEARTVYWHYIDMHSRLTQHPGFLPRLAGVRDQIPRSEPGASPVLGFLGNLGQTGWGQISGHPLSFSLAALAGILLATFLVVAGRHPQPASPVPQVAFEEKAQASHPEQPAEQPRTHLMSQIPPSKATKFAAGQVATLTGVYQARWGGPVQDIALGSRLAAGRELHLEAGLAEITFKLGARVIVEAPAHLRLTSIDGLHVLDGKVTVRADTEDARGFVVHSPIARMVDLGTEFGAKIEDRQTDLHVFQGMVEVNRSDESASRCMRLTAGQRLLIRSDGEVEVPSQSAEPSHFTRDLATAENDCRRWERWSRSIRKDQDLVGYYTFEQGARSRRGTCAAGREAESRDQISCPTWPPPAPRRPAQFAGRGGSRGGGPASRPCSSPGATIACGWTCPAVTRCSPWRPGSTWTGWTTNSTAC